MTQSPSIQRTKWPMWLSLLCLLLLGVALSLTLDEQALVQSAYGLPMLSYRALTYALIATKAKKVHAVPILICLLFNELFIFLTWSGAVTLWS